MLEQYFTIKQLAEKIPISGKTWYDLMRRGEIRFTKTNPRGRRGGLVLISESAVEAWLAAHDSYVDARA